jgi:hypothetical protein
VEAREPCGDCNNNNNNKVILIVFMKIIADENFTPTKRLIKKNIYCTYKISVKFVQIKF